MSKIQDVISFGPGTGLNWDDDLQTMPKGDSSNRLNVSLDEGAKGNILSKSKGNLVLKNIIDPISAINTWTTSAQITPTRVRYTYVMSNDYLYLNGAYITSGICFNILTDNNNFKFFHKNNLYSTLVSACNNIISIINEKGDALIYYAGYTAGSSSTTFYVDILDSSESKGVRSLKFVYGELGVINDYFNSASKEIVGEYYNEKDNDLYTFWGADSYANPSPYSDNVILKYNYNSGLTEVLNSTYLTIPSTITTWNRSNMIKACVIGDDDSKLLYWTDGIAPTMNINVEMAINTVYGYFGDAYTDHSTDELRNIALNLIKQQPQYGAYAFFGSSGDPATTVEVTKYPFQFIYRYIFQDNEVSTWSVISETAFNINLETADGLFYGDNINVNEFLAYIDVPETGVISKVQVAYRTTNADRWKIFETYDASSGIVAVSFNGTELSEVIDDGSANILYDNVPLKSGVISSINDNRLLLADNTVGFANTDLDVTLTPVSVTNTVSNDEEIVWKNAVTINSTTKDLYPSYADLDIFGSVYMVFKTSLKEHIIQYDAYNIVDTVVTQYFVDYINNNIVGSDTNIVSAAVDGVNNVRITHTAGNWLYGYVACYGAYRKIMKVKNGITHNLGIVYYDQFGRRGFVNKADPTYVPFYTEQSTFTDNEYVDVIQVEINNTPPAWAHSWAIYYGDNSPRYIQTILKVDDFTRDSGNLRIKVDEILNNIKLLNPQFRGSYQFTPGDRIRWIGTLGNYTNAYGSKKRVTLLTEYIDSEVLGYSGDFNEYLVVKDYTTYTTSQTSIDLATYVLIELYSPTKTDEVTFYYETPYKFPVSNPGTADRLHQVIYDDVSGSIHQKQEDAYGITVRDQTDSVSAVCYLDKTDYRQYQHFYFDSTGPMSCYVDSQSFSSYMDSRLRNYGKPHIVNPDSRQIRLNTIQWGNTFIPNSRINGLSTFGFSDEKSMDDKFGRITGLEVTGDVLNVVQNSKLSSIYLGAVLSKDANGNEILSYSNVIIGEARASVEIYGSFHKYSIVKNGNYVYGFDIQTAVCWRKSNAGVEDISGYKMKSYFKNKVEALKISGFDNVIVVAGFDDFKKIYYLTFVDLYNSANSETLGFHEPTNRWFSFYSFIPDMYGSINNVQFLTFKNGFMYVQNAGVNCNYFGTQYGSEVNVVYNQGPTQVKTFESIQENSNAIWDMPDTDSILVDSDALEYKDPRDYTHHKANMQSRLKEGRFRYKHGEFHAGFLRDMSTRTTANTYDLFCGRKLRGKTLVCKLENDSTSNVYLRSVTINANV